MKWNYREPDLEPDAVDECNQCNDLEAAKEDMSDWFKAVVDQLYGLEEYDADLLDHRIEELTNYFQISMPPTMLKIQKKE